MRRMATTKELNLVEELNKFIKFQPGEFPEIKQGFKLDVSVDDLYYFFGSDGTLRGSDSFDTDGIYCKKTEGIRIYGIEGGVNITGPSDYSLSITDGNTFLDGEYVYIYSDVDTNLNATGSIILEGEFIKLNGLPTSDPNEPGAL